MVALKCTIKVHWEGGWTRYNPPKICVSHNSETTVKNVKESRKMWMKMRMMSVWSVSVTVGAEKRPQLTLGDQFLLENDLFRSSTSAQYTVSSTLGAQHQHLPSWPVPSSKFKVQPRGVILFLSIFWYMTEDSQNIFILINNGFDGWTNLGAIPSDYSRWNI